MNIKKGVFWSGIERFSSQGAQFLLNIIIARLLLPEDYGVIAMLSIFLSVSQTFIDSGFGNALIQKKDRTDIDYCTVFYFNIAISIFIYLILYIAAPCIASFYETPELIDITRIVGITLIINSFAIVQQAKIIIELDFKKQTIATLIAVLISGVIAIIMAYYNYGVWALVVQNIINNIVRVFLLWILSGWAPKLIFSMNSFFALFRFGSKLLISSILHVLYTNMYALVIGKKYSPTDLGCYSRSYSFANFPSMNISSILERAIYPVLCSAQDDIENLKKQFIKYMRLGCFIVFPTMMCLAAVSEPFIRVVLTDKWMSAAPLLQILSIAFLWDPIMRLNHLVINAKGRSDLFLKSEIYKKLIGISILFLTLPFGVKVICIGLITYAFVDMAIIIHYNTKITHIGYIRQIKEITPIFLSAALSGILAFSIVIITKNTSPTLQLLSGCTGGIISFILIIKTIKLQEYKIGISMIKKLLKKA